MWKRGGTIRGEPRKELERLEHDGVGPIAPGSLHLVAEPPIGERRDRRARHEQRSHSCAIGGRARYRQSRSILARSRAGLATFACTLNPAKTSSGGTRRGSALPAAGRRRTEKAPGKCPTCGAPRDALRAASSRESRSTTSNDATWRRSFAEEPDWRSEGCFHGRRALPSVREQGAHRSRSRERCGGYPRRNRALENVAEGIFIGRLRDRPPRRRGAGTGL